MKYLKLYENFSRQPLYHFTNKLFHIISNDVLLLNNPVLRLKNKGKSISFTRNSKYRSGDGFLFRISLDSDKMRNFGYIPNPISEYNISLSDSNYSYIPKNQNEERLYKDIIDVGKFINFIDINIDFDRFKSGKETLETLIFKKLNNEIIKSYIDFSNEMIDNLFNYLLKYPNISLRLMSEKLEIPKEIFLNAQKIKEYRNEIH